MSFSARGNAISSDRRYRDSLAANESATASLESLYNSELASLSGHGKNGNNGHIFVEDNQYPLPQSHSRGDEQQQQLYHFQPEQTHTSLPVQSLPRSSPIAIIRGPGDGNNEGDESDGDDDDSEIDVEGDAIKLQRKYGNKVIQTYMQDSTILDSLNTKVHNKPSVLNAPYLGSLSKSVNQVSSLPPMSLTGNETYIGEPPESTMSYGSLRDSHERGRFLDGPSSYREPTSGKIYHLDHRLRYHGRQPELNIGERLQQSRKLRELRQKEESKRLKEGSRCEADGNDGASGEGLKQERKPVTSSLTDMMRDASQTVNTAGLGFKDGPEGSSEMSLGPGGLVPIHNDRASIHTYDHITSFDRSPKNMLSTSLTAFELLKSSNTETISRSNSIVERSFSINAQTGSNQQQTTDVRYQSGFQPLARSMSDPSPRFQHLSLSDASPPGRIVTTVLAEGLAGEMEQTMQQPGNAQLVADYAMGNTNYPFVYNNGTAHNVISSPALASQQRMNIFDQNSRHPSPPQDHDPDVDGAFGDMDM